MANVNKVILIGRLGNQPELKYTPSNRAVTELRLAVNRSWTDRASGQRQEKTDWFSVEVWDKNSENCEKYLAKGREVYVEGRLSNDEWTDKEGQKRTKTKIVAETIQFIGGRAEGGGDEPRRSYEPRAGGAPARGPAPGMGDGPGDDFGSGDDIPF
jgi:single-strand DNA-binding protein